jgi:hypothetical protein
MKQYPEINCPKDARLQRSNNIAIAPMQQSAGSAWLMYGNNCDINPL